MFPLFLLGIALLIGFYLLARAFVNADPKSLARGVRYTTIGVTVIVVVFLAVTGRLGAAMAVGAFVVPMVLRWRVADQPGQGGRRSVGRPDFNR